MPSDGRRAPTAPPALQELRLRLPAVPRLRFLLELIECALPAHAPQSGRPQLDAVALQLVYLISSGLREASAGQERRPGLIYRRSAPPTRQKCLAAPSLNTVYCAFNQAHNCSAATREAGAPRPGFNASISSVTAAPEGAGQRTRPPVAIFRFGTRSFKSFFDSSFTAHPPRPTIRVPQAHRSSRTRMSHRCSRSVGNSSRVSFYRTPPLSASA